MLVLKYERNSLFLAMTQKKGINHVLQTKALAERHFQVLPGKRQFQLSAEFCLLPAQHLKAWLT